MVDPVGATLGAVGLLAPIYDACDRLYHGYTLTQAFGTDFILIQQVINFDTVSPFLLYSYNALLILGPKRTFPFICSRNILE
jgi:hypothetical protein